MVRREVALRLMSANYRPDLLGEPDTIWKHPQGKFTVKIRYGGSVLIWYHRHPRYFCWDGRRFWERSNLDRR